MRFTELSAPKPQLEPMRRTLPDPVLLTADEVASLLRTTRKAIYIMAERGALPGVVRIGRRLLFRRDTLLHWLRQKSAPSLER
jgi:excisionase family DNA binding protein